MTETDVLCRVEYITSWKEKPLPKQDSSILSKWKNFGTSFTSCIPSFLVRSISSHTEVSSAKMLASPSGNLLAVLTDQGVIVIQLNATTALSSSTSAMRATKASQSTTPKLLVSFNLPKDPFPSFRTLAWSPDNRLLAVSTSNGTLLVLDVVGGNVVFSLRNEATFGLEKIKKSTDTEKASTQTDLLDKDAFPTSNYAAIPSSLQPISIIFFRESNSVGENAERRPFIYKDKAYGYYLTLITASGILRSYFFNLLHSKSTRQPLARDESELNQEDYLDKHGDLPIHNTYSSVGVPGFFVLQHHYTFQEYYSCVLCGYWDDSTLYLSGIPQDFFTSAKENLELTPHITAWKLSPIFPFYKSFSISIPSPKEISSLESSRVLKPPNNWSKITRFVHKINPIRSIPESCMNSIPYSLVLSPSKTSIASLDSIGNISLWTAPQCTDNLDSGVVWFSVSRFSFNVDSIGEANSLQKECESQSANKDTAVQIFWWNDMALTVITSHGNVLVCHLETPLIGDKAVFRVKSVSKIQKFSLNTFLVPINFIQQRYFALEVEKCVLRARIRKGKPIAFSRINSESKEWKESTSINSSKESSFIATFWCNLFFFMKALLYYFTSTFLWNFESPSSDNLPKVVYYEQSNRRLSCICRTTPLETLSDYVYKEKYDEALILAEQYNLSTDIIYQARWLQKTALSHRGYDEESLTECITSYLEPITDREWVMGVLFEVPICDFEYGRKLYEYGIDQTGIALKKQIKITEDQRKFIIRCRLLYLRYMDRLSTFKEIEASCVHSIQSQSFSDRFREFRDMNLVLIAIEYAFREEFTVLSILFTHHGKELLPFRLHILEHILESIHPAKYKHLLPIIRDTIDDNVSDGKEEEWPIQEWRSQMDWCEAANIKQEVAWLDDADEYNHNEDKKSFNYGYPCNSEKLCDWYIHRAIQIDERSGCIDIAVALIKFAVENNIPGIETFYDDLTTFNDYLYKGHAIKFLDITEMYGAAERSLSSFRNLNEVEVLGCLLEDVTEDDVIQQCQEKVLPFIRRLSRKWNDKEKRPMSLFFDYLKSSATSNLQICTKVFEASKPTLPTSQRVIEHDKDLADIILVCLYESGLCGNYNDPVWGLMWRMYECLPDFDAMGFKGSDFVHLQQRIDRLEDHLSIAEILAYYAIPMDLSVIKEADNSQELQLRILTKLTHCGLSDTANEDARGVKEDSTIPISRFENMDVWLALLDDILLKLKKEHQLFSLIKEENLYLEFLRGALSEGNVVLVKELLKNGYQSKSLPISETNIEKLLIEQAQELYNNSESADIHFGQMKKAFDCLHLIKPTSKMLKEIGLIESTHYLITRCHLPSSFVLEKLQQKPKKQKTILTDDDFLPLALPIQVRLHPDRALLLNNLLDCQSTFQGDLDALFEILDKLRESLNEKESPATWKQSLDILPACDISTEEQKAFYRIRLLCKLTELSFFNELSNDKWGVYANRILEEAVGDHATESRRRGQRLRIIRDVLLRWESTVVSTTSQVCGQFNEDSLENKYSGQDDVYNLWTRGLKRECRLCDIWGRQEKHEWTPLWILFSCLAEHVLTSSSTISTTFEKDMLKTPLVRTEIGSATIEKPNERESNMIGPSSAPAETVQLKSPVSSSSKYGATPTTSESSAHSILARTPFKIVAKLAELPSSMPILGSPLNFLSSTGSGNNLRNLTPFSSTSVAYQTSTLTMGQYYLSQALYFCPEDALNDLLFFCRSLLGHM